MRYLSGVATLRLSPEKCSGCGRCVEVCPHQVFAIGSGKARLVDRDACMECGACRTNCAVSAIEVRPGVGCAMALVSAMLARGSPERGCCSV
jgi:NAD-dependent dihydropyrimidine dehydrogenase PreA subunit